MLAARLPANRRLPLLVFIGAAALTGIFGLASGAGVGLYLLALVALIAIMMAIVVSPIVGTAIALVVIFLDPVHPIDPNQSLLSAGPQTKMALFIWLAIVGAGIAGTLFATLQNHESLLNGRSTTLACAAALAAVGTISLPFADSTHESMLRLIPTWVGIAAVWMIGQNTRTPGGVRVLIIVMAVASLANGLLGRHGLHGNTYETGIHRLAGVVGDPNFLALQLGMVLFLLPLIVGHRTRGRLITCALLGGGLLAMIMLTVSRGALVAIAAGALVAFVIGKSGKVRLLIILVACVGGIYVAHSTFEHRSEVRAAAGDGNGRTDAWSDAIGVWVDHPLLGVGVGNYVDVASQHYNRIANATHNIFLESLTELGIIGFFLFSIPMGIVVVRVTRTAAQARAPAAIWCLLTVTYGLTAAMFLDPLFFAPFWVVLGLVDRWLTLTAEQTAHSVSTRDTAVSLT